MNFIDIYLSTLIDSLEKETIDTKNHKISETEQVNEGRIQITFWSLRNRSFFLKIHNENGLNVRIIQRGTKKISDYFFVTSSKNIQQVHSPNRILITSENSENEYFLNSTTNIQCFFIYSNSYFDFFEEKGLIKPSLSKSYEYILDIGKIGKMLNESVSSKAGYIRLNNLKENIFNSILDKLVQDKIEIILNKKFSAIENEILNEGHEPENYIFQKVQKELQNSNSVSIELDSVKSAFKSLNQRSIKSYFKSKSTHNIYDFFKNNNNEFLDFLDSQFSNHKEIFIQNLAEKLNTDKESIQEISFLIFRESILQVFEKYKIARVANLLERQNLSSKDLSQLSGYSNSSKLNILVNKQLDISLKEYKKKINQKQYA